MEEPRDKQQREQARADYSRETGGVPAHMQAAAEAAGEDSPASGPQDIGMAAHSSGEQALHGSGEDVANEVRGLPLRWAFDEHNPPSPELIDDCVHCGFCLPTCPTYVLWGEEMDSPRGRIHLMKLASEGEIGMTDTFVRHIDQCLGCMACVTACPSGVQYEKLIESTRGQIERRHRRGWGERLLRNFIFETFPRPERLRVLAMLLLPYQKLGLHGLVRRSGLLSRLPAQLAAMHGVMPDVSLRGLRRRIPYRVEARGRRRARVGLLTGCVQRVFFSETNAATVRVLRAEGCEVVTPPGQGCCGALALHAGREKQAQQYARKLIDVFEREGVDFVAVNAAGCGSSMKEYGHLLRDDPEYAERAARFSQSVRDVTELLVELGPVATRHPLDVEIAYHDACHLAHAQGIRREPRELLEGIPGVELLPVAEADICCGSAGIYNLVEPGPASELGDRKARHIMQTGARIVASANPGCTLQIRAAAERAGGSLRVMHPVEIVDLSLRGSR